jgi:hypothetical protein
VKFFSLSENTSEAYSHMGFGEIFPKIPCAKIALVGDEWPRLTAWPFFHPKANFSKKLGKQQ